MAIDKLDADTVRKVALEIIGDTSPWEYGGPDDIGYMKTSMYNAGVIDMANEIIHVIEGVMRKT